MQKVIIDIREPIEYAAFHLNGAINIPYDKLMNNYKNLLNKEYIYYFYCSKGVLSKKASIYLKANGYNTNTIK